MSATAASPSPHWSHRWCALTLLLAVCLAYAGTLSAPFVFDDTDAVLRNPTIKKFWSLDALTPPTNGSTTTGRPLVNLSFALNHALSGEDPWSYHALNLAIHALATLTLFGLVRRTLVSLNAQPSTLISFSAALLWSLHPLQTETVVCTAQRTESLCALFYLLTLYTFVRGTESSAPLPVSTASAPPAPSPQCNLIGYTVPGRRAGWRALSLVACLAGMACKEVMATAPLLVLLYDRTFVVGNFAAALRARRTYYAALACTWLLLAWLVLRSGGSRGVAAGLGLGVSPWHYLLTQCDALVLYLRLALWPHPLVLDYGNAVVTSFATVWWQALVVLALLAATAWFLVRKPFLGFALASFFLILAPSSSFIPLVTQTIAEHRMYLPLAGLLALVVVAAHRRFGVRAAWALTLLAFPLGAATVARTRDYRSELALWQDNVALRPHARALTALGVALLHAGCAAEALPYFTRALALEPSHLSAQRNRALALLQLGRAAEAAAILAALPAREPGEAAEFFALGNAFVRDQKFAEAAAAYSRTLALEPAHAAAHANLGNALLLLGRPREALAHYEEVVRLRPDDARARENLALARDALRSAP